MSLVLFTCLMFGHYFIFQIYVFFNKIYLGIIEIIILKSYLSRNSSLEVSYDCSSDLMLTSDPVFIHKTIY